MTSLILIAAICFIAYRVSQAGELLMARLSEPPKEYWAHRRFP